MYLWPFFLFGFEQIYLIILPPSVFRALRRLLTSYRNILNMVKKKDLGARVGVCFLGLRNAVQCYAISFGHLGAVNTLTYYHLIKLFGQHVTKQLYTLNRHRAALASI